MSDLSIAIIGGGVSALICAYELEQHGFAPVIFEKSDRVGGRLKTDIVNGIPLDHGFQVMLSAYPAAQHYLDYEALDLKEFLPGSALFYNGKHEIIGDFMRAPELFPFTVASRTGSIRDKLRTYFHTRSVRNSNLDHIFSKKSISTIQLLNNHGYSDKIINKFYRPFFGGIFLEKELHTSSRMFEFIFKMLSEGLATIPNGGIEEIPRQLAAKLKTSTIHVNSPVKGIEGSSLLFDESASKQFDVIIDGTNYFFEQSEMAWHGCNTHYFFTTQNVLGKPLIGLLSEANSVINSFHYLNDLFDLPTQNGHVLSVTTVDSQSEATVELDQVIQELKESLSIDVTEHLGSYHVPQSLPILQEVRYSPAPESLRVRPGLYRIGDSLANPSLNGAMESGKAAAMLVQQDALA